MKMTAPKGATSVSYDGVTYEVKKGVVVVPHEAAGQLAGHGYTVTGDPDDDADLAVEQALVDRRKSLAAPALPEGEGLPALR